MKIWLAFEEPKSVIMLRPLYEELVARGHRVFITARDFDSTYHLLDEWGVPYYKTGEYGGGTMLGKLKAYADHLTRLITVVEKEQPEFLFCITAPEAIRVAFGLRIPNIMFNDEPRSFGCSALTLPYADRVIVPAAIPTEWYTEIYAVKPDKLVKFNGIDEVAWLNRNVFHPDKKIPEKLGLIPGKYFVCRTEPTLAVYLLDKMKPHETALTEIIPKTLEFTGKEYTYVIITRNEPQYEYLTGFFRREIEEGIVRIYRGLAGLQHIMYYSAMVWSGCGTMIREAALMGVPSISFWPMDTYPQEKFLMDNGFPLRHIRDDIDGVVKAVGEFLDYERKDTWDKIEELDNPITVALELFGKMVNSS